MADSSKPLKVREKNWELYVYTNRWIKIEEEPQNTRGAKNAPKSDKNKK